MPVPTNLRFFGVAKEAVKGNPVSPTFYVPYKTFEPQDLPIYLPVEVFKGSMAEVYGMVPGFKHTEAPLAGPVFPDAIGWPLMGILGDITTTASRSVNDGVTNSTTTVTSATAAFTAADVGKNISGGSIPSGAFIASVTNGTTIILSAAATASASGLTVVIGCPQSHSGSLKNSGDGQPTSHTLTDYYAVTQARQYAGVQWHEFELKFSAEGLLEYSAKSTGLVPSAQVTKPTQSFSALLPIPTWQGVAQIGGSLMAKSMDGTVTITRKLALVPGLNGTQQYSAVFVGGETVKVKLTAFIDDDTEELRMLNNTQPALNLNWCTGAGASASQLALFMSQVSYTKAKRNPGKEYMAIDIEGEAIANTTDVGASGGFSPLRALLGNNVAAGTYI